MAKPPNLIGWLEGSLREVKVLRDPIEAPKTARRLCGYLGHYLREGQQPPEALRHYFIAAMERIEAGDDAAKALNIDVRTGGRSKIPRKEKRKVWLMMTAYILMGEAKTETEAALLYVQEVHAGEADHQKYVKWYRDVEQGR